MAGERVIVFTPEKNEAFLDDPDILYVKYQVPHAWLFPRVKLAIHHGGAGTVAYALKAGIPQIIMPFFGDHFLWAHHPGSHQGSSEKKVTNQSFPVY